MALEKIVKYAKIASTNKINLATYTIVGTVVGLAIADGKINSMDIITLLGSGIATAFATVSSVEGYKFVKKICEEHGFTGYIISHKHLRRNAKIYAAESGRTEEFALALKQYQR